MLNRCLHIYILLGLLCSPSVISANVLRIDQGSSHYNLKEFINIYPSSEELELSALSSLREDSFLPSIEINQYQSAPFVYGYFDLQNDQQETLDWWINFANNDYVEVYIRDKSYQTGFLAKGSQKPIVAGSYYVPITILPNDEVRVFFRLKKDFHDYNLNFTIDNPYYRVNGLWYKKLWAMFLQGIFAIMIAFGLLLYVRLKEDIYLFYSLYLASTAIFYLFSDSFLREYLIPEYPKLTYLFLIALCPSAIFYFIFLKKFIDFQQLSSWTRKMVDVLLKFDYGATAIILAVYFISKEEYLGKLCQLFIIINALVALTTLWQIVKRKVQLGMYFIMGSSFLLVSTIVDATFWDSNLVWGSFTKVGIVIEVIFFSLGMGERVRLNQREKDVLKQQLIRELENSKKLIQDQKDVLEEKVKERTYELASQNEQLLAAKVEADMALNAKSEFLSIMSHEIRTPMNGVIGMTHLLLDEINDPMQQENLNSLKFSAENLLTLLNDILDFNKIESGNIELETLNFSLRELIKSLQHQFVDKAEKKGISFTVDVDKDIPDWLIGDPSRITQILMNLLSNAIKFTSVGGVTLKTYLVSGQTDGVADIIFEVNDTGIGIPKDKQSLIFDQFTQASSDTSRRFGGTGLGLAIIKRLLELMNSKIVLDSTLGVGSKFYFKLRLQVGKKETVIIEDNIDEKIEALRNLKILSVDDNLMNRMVLDKFFKKWGIASESVDSGDKAIAKMIDMKSDYDLILLDLQMPDLNGYQVSQMIRAMDGERYQNIPIIALSADIFANVYNEVLESGMNDFVSKPFDPEELIQTLYKNTR